MTKIHSSKKRSLRAAIFLLSGVLLATGCKKPDEDLGFAVQPDSDRLNLNIVDTSSIVAYTLLEDSLSSSGLTFNLLGSYTDPQFGFTESSIFTQLRLSAFLDNNDLDLNFLAIDSVVLALKYSDHFYGGTDLQRFRVFRVTEDMDGDTVYYSNDELAYDPTDLIEIGFQIQAPAPVDSVTIGGVRSVPQMRFRLDTAFGRELLNESANGILNDQAAFIDYMKGLYIFPDNNIPAADYGGIFAFDLEDGNSKMTIYYRITEPGLEDTLQYDFAIDEDALRYSKFKHDYTGYPVGDQLADPSLGSDVVYVQALAGVKTKLDFPYIMNYVDSGMVAFNRAELVINTDDALTGSYLPNSRIIVLAAPDDGIGSGSFTPDFFEGDVFFDGFLEPSTGQYRINVTRYLQNILNGNNSNTGLYLISISSGITANRTVIYGPGAATSDKMKLEIIYTEY